jgi:hypothetical protein
LYLDLGLSHLALVTRYAQHCEAQNAARLRQLCETKGQDLDRLLTSDLSHYLAGVGISPLIDDGGDVPRRRRPPRVPSAAYYAEARQYTTSNPGAPIRRAYTQVWGTLGRLRKIYRCTAAFLVVFRRAGRLVELPPVIDFDDLRLYSVLVDLSPDHERSAAIRFTEANLRPAL